ncbi:hypothetical protein N431DRAFT_553856 [Stipitochalara longipes BDJ]|nr:hypothetical protein N431DRAFT_553856 [Stipitochalara longipes BDJ]
MLFSNPVVLASLALLSVVSSQVVVTVTNTVTVVTVTVPPKTTSTSIVYVTVDEDPPTSTKTTSTKTVIVTATTATVTVSCPIAEWGQCGGNGFQTVCGSGCSSGLVCTYQNDWYSYCAQPQNVQPQTVVVKTSTRWRGWRTRTATAI